MTPMLIALCRLYARITALVMACIIFLYVCLVAIVILSYMFMGLTSTATESEYSYDIEDYEHYTYNSDIFLESLPDYVYPERFKYAYEYYRFEEIYLELEFDSSYDTERYVNELRKHIEEEFGYYDKPVSTKPYKELENPYNSSYTDIFCFGSDYIYFDEYSHSYEPLTGYELYTYGESFDIKGCYGIISYSLDENKVIQNCCWIDASSYLPEYLSYFGVDPYDDDIYMWINVPNDTSILYATSTPAITKEMLF